MRHRMLVCWSIRSSKDTSMLDCNYIISNIANGNHAGQGGHTRTPNCVPAPVLPPASAPAPTSFPPRDASPRDSGGKALRTCSGAKSFPTTWGAAPGPYSGWAARPLPLPRPALAAAFSAGVGASRTTPVRVVRGPSCGGGWGGRGGGGIVKWTSIPLAGLNDSFSSIMSFNSGRDERDGKAVRMGNAK